MVSKIQDWLYSFQNRVHHLYKSVQFAEKRPRKPDTGIRDCFEEMEQEFSFGTFLPEKQGYLCRRFFAPGNLKLERPDKSCSIYPVSNRIFWKLFQEQVIEVASYSKSSVMLIFDGFTFRHSGWTNCTRMISRTSDHQVASYSKSSVMLIFDGFTFRHSGWTNCPRMISN